MCQRETPLGTSFSNFRTSISLIHLVSDCVRCEAKENDISLDRQSLFDHQKTLKQGQERLLEGQALLNQRDEYILERSQKLSRLEKELEAEKVKMDQDRKALIEEKSNLDLKMVSLTSREEVRVFAFLHYKNAILLGACLHFAYIQ